MLNRARTEVEQVAHKQASQSILKGLDLIDALVNAPGPLSLNELARTLQRPVPTVHRLLRTLSLRNWVESVDGRYRLTLKMFEIGMSVVEKIDLVAEARPLCEELRDKYNETVNVSVRSGASVVYIAKMERQPPLRLISQLGMHVPLHCTAMGKTLLAFAEPKERAHLLSLMPLEARTRNTITDRRALEPELEAIRARGWSVDNQEFDVGITCIAAPIFDSVGDAAGAISLTAATERMAEPTWEAIGQEVRRVAAAISLRLGYGIPGASLNGHASKKGS